MSVALQTEAIPEPIVEPAILASPNLLLRKCACGGSAGMNADCPECSGKRLSLQRKVSGPGDPLELEADRLAEQVMRSLGSTSRAVARPSRAPVVAKSDSSDLGNVAIFREACEPERPKPAASDQNTPAQHSPAPAAAGATTSRPASAGLIVEDNAAQITPGQMRKSQFLAELKASVCAAADAELAAVGRSAKGCPYIENWINHYRSKDSRHVERALHKFAPEAAGLTSAREYIPIVSNRIRRSVSVWATTGKITGVPDELAGEIPGGGLLGAISGLISGIGSALSGLVSGIGSAASSIASGAGKAVGSLSFKAREGGPTEADPAYIRSQLGAGQSLESSVKQRMEPAFGHSFSHVMVHNDPTAARLAANLNARAFTVGEHIAFGPEEYRPGSIIGDALIAHELAHVVQQDGVADAEPNKRGEDGNTQLEEDADRAAAGAIASTWAGVTGPFLDRLGASAKPRLRSGLGLRRCGPALRTAPVTQAEADRYIQGRFGRLVAGAIADGRTASLSTLKPVDQATIEKECAASDAYKAKEGAKVDSSECSQIIAFVDNRYSHPNVVWINPARQGPETVLHEALHVYSDPAFADKLRNVINEGTTEYFSRQIAKAQNLAVYGGYEERYQQIRVLVDVLGSDEPLANAYFRGDIKGLKHAVEAKRRPPTFEAWRCEMTLKNFEIAEPMLRGTAEGVSVRPLCRESTVLPPLGD
jgi:hypothetical protein